jgi:hypothetical protein
MSGLILFLQDRPKNEIRILIDRPPNTLSVSQNPDSMARKILPLLTEGHYQLSQSSTLEDFYLIPGRSNEPKLHFTVARDDLARGILFEEGKADVLFDTLSLSKTNWFKEHDRSTLESEGFHLSYLGFNLKDPILRNSAVREAISLALPVDAWVKYKYFGWVRRSPEAPPLPDLARARSLLDSAGYKAPSQGPRFHLSYLTTPVREGNELALLTREALKQIDIAVDVIPLETSLFFSRLKKGDFELFGARIMRTSNEESIAEYLKSSGLKNYFSYSNAALDDELQKNSELPWIRAKKYVLQDRPFIPLFIWKHGLLLSSRVKLRAGDAFQSDDSFRFLTELQLK